MIIDNTKVTNVQPFIIFNQEDKTVVVNYLNGKIKKTI